jgi:superfamily II DNA or RNA helicase
MREYQKNSILKLRESLASGKKRVVYYLPTGGGKTVVAAEIIRLATNKGKKVAFICNRIDLVKQTSEHLSKVNIPHGIIQGGNSHTTESNVVVCSIKTIARRGLPDVDFIIIDECHGVPGSSEYRCLLTRFNALPVVGLTATPFSKGMGEHCDGLNGNLFQDLIIGETISNLIEMEYLVDVEIYAPSEPDVSGIKIVAGDYNKKELGEAVDKQGLIGDIVAHYMRLAMGKLAIVFATNVAHSQHIVAEFTAHGIEARHVDGYMEDEERRPIIDAFKNGEFRVLSNCSLLSEGFDCPETEVIILARPTRSLNRYIQMVGRGLRPFNGKEVTLVLDHSGTVKRLGFPTDELPLELDDGRPKEKQESQELLPKVCKQCYFVYPRSEQKCPSCGFEPIPTPKDVETQDGMLVKIIRGKSGSMEKGKSETFTREQKQQVYSALVQEKKPNWAEGWISNNYKDIVGVWPKALDRTPGPLVKIVEDHLIFKKIQWNKSKETKDNGIGPKSGQDHCPKCFKQDYRDRPAAGPHGLGRQCNSCNAVWWLKKAKP